MRAEEGREEGEGMWMKQQTTKNISLISGGKKRALNSERMGEGENCPAELFVS